MTNLADLLPAGGGQNNTDFVADGTISSGAPVLLTAAGKAAPISGTAAVTGNLGQFEAATTQETAAVYDSNSNKVVVVYRDDGNSYYATSVVGTITGGSTNTVSWGTPVVIVSYGCNAFAPVFQSHDNQIVLGFQAFGGGYGSRLQVIAGEVNGTSMDWYSSGAYDPDSNNSVDYVSAAYDANAQKTVLAWKSNDYTTGAYSVESCVVSVSGTGTSANATTGAISQLDNGGDIIDTSCVYDSNVNKVLVTFGKSYDSYKGFGRVGTISGTSISYGTEAQFMTGKQPLQVGTAFDTSANKIVITGGDNANSSQGDCCLGTISGTDITYSTPVVFSTGNGSGVGNYSKSPIATVYNPDTNKTLVAFFNIGDSYSGQYVEGTVSGSTISFSAATTFEAAVSGQVSANYISAAYDTNVDRFLIAFVPYATGPYYGQGRVIQVGTTNLTSTNLLGLAPQAISDTATGTINTWGSRCESASLSLAAALRFGTSAVFEAANAGVITETFDSTNNKVVVAYKDSGNSNYGTAAVGTVSGSSISFGTPAVFESAEVGELSAAFDSNENRVVISYRDAGNSNYGTAVVGQVSGTSISFGTAATFSGTNASYNTSTAFDSSNNKIVVSYRDNGNSNYGTAVVGTVSGASITFGTPVVYSAAGTTNYGSITYDSTSNKIVLCYQVSTDEKAIVGTVSGTSISFGSEATAAASSSPSFRSLSFDSTNNRVVDTYSDGSTGACTSVVGTVSGTSISFGTPVIADSANTGYVGSAFDVSTGKIVIVYNASSSGLANTGTVSGTTITFGDKVTFLSGDPNHVGAVYDSNANRVVVSYSDSTNSNYGTSIVASSGTAPLTVGTKYYVTPSGSFSSSAGDPSVNAGLAISTTSLLLNGDS